jgi:hypothetical protein
MLLFASAALVSLSCGPSFQVVYEGDSRFEHCYALDENPNVLMQQKSECWSDWIQHYTYGQTRDRVEFAALRYRAILRAGALPTDEAVMGAAPGEALGTSALAAPAPTNAFAAPPRTLVDYGSPGQPNAPPTATVEPAHSPAPAPAVSPLPQPAPPGATCVDGCSDAWRSCRSSCADKACAACDKTYGKCARGCFGK